MAVKYSGFVFASPSVLAPSGMSSRPKISSIWMATIGRLHRSSVDSCLTVASKSASTAG
jgi:hypothetical protein